MKETVKLKRDLDAIQIPFGISHTLPKDTEVNIEYSLGSSYTITTQGNMYRVESKDADALGKESITFSLAENENSTLENKIWGALRTCYDPEIPVNIVDLGLVYGIDITKSEKDENKFSISIRMTLTAPGCGMGPFIAEDAKQRVLSLPEVESAKVDMVFDPPWDRSMMSEQAKLELGIM